MYKKTSTVSFSLDIHMKRTTTKPKLIYNEIVNNVLSIIRNNYSKSAGFFLLISKQLFLIPVNSSAKGRDAFMIKIKIFVFNP